MIDLPLPCQPYARYEAGTEINHSLIDAWQMGVRVEHGTSIAKKRRNLRDM